MIPRLFIPYPSKYTDWADTGASELAQVSDSIYLQTVEQRLTQLLAFLF